MLIGSLEDNYRDVDLCTFVKVIAAQRVKQQFIILTYDIVFGGKISIHLTAQLDHTASRALQPEYFAAFGFIVTCSPRDLSFHVVIGAEFARATIGE